MKKYDLIVAGGGLTGVAAAVSAARLGQKVLLAEKSGWLGGAMSNSLVFPFMRWWTPKAGEEVKELSDGIFTEMRERLGKYALPDKKNHYDPEYFKFVLDLAMAAAARRPSPMARITVAPPRTISPPA